MSYIQLCNARLEMEWPHHIGLKGFRLPILDSGIQPSVCRSNNSALQLWTCEKKIKYYNHLIDYLMMIDEILHICRYFKWTQRYFKWTQRYLSVPCILKGSSWFKFIHFVESEKNYWKRALWRKFFYFKRSLKFLK